MSIWDFHCHFSGVSGDTPSSRIDELLKYADRIRIERICLSMGMTWSHNPDPADMSRQNDEVMQAVRHRPERVFGFVYLNPNHIEASMEEIERCVSEGPLVGIKLWVARRCHDPILDPIAKRAAELQVPILQHAYLKAAGNLPGESTPADLAELAARHQDTSFICAHAGAEWETALRTLRSLKNVSVDISGSDPTAGLVEMAVRELGAERVLFGSDAGGRSFGSQLGKVIGAEISEGDRMKILSRNAKRLLGPILARKGIKV